MTFITQEEYERFRKEAGCPMCGVSLDSEGVHFMPCPEHKERKYPGDMVNQNKGEAK